MKIIWLLMIELWAPCHHMDSWKLGNWLVFCLINSNLKEQNQQSNGIFCWAFWWRHHSIFFVILLLVNRCVTSSSLNCAWEFLHQIQCHLEMMCTIVEASVPLTKIKNLMLTSVSRNRTVLLMFARRLIQDQATIIIILLIMRQRQWQHCFCKDRPSSPCS